MKRRYPWAVAATVAGALALSLLAPQAASAAPPPFVTQGWTYTFAPEGGTSLFSSVTPSYADFAGVGDDVEGWTIGALPIASLSTLLATTATWGISTVTQVGDTATVTTTLGGFPVTVDVTGPLQEFSITLPDQPIVSGSFLWFDPTALGAADYGTAGTASRLWFDSAAARGAVGAFRLGPLADWLAFIDPGTGSTLFFPDGPVGPTILGGTFSLDLVLLGAAPCPSDRSTRLEGVASALPALPSDAAILTELDCGSLGGGQLVSGGSSLFTLNLPQSLLNTGYVNDPASLRASFTGLPAGITASLDPSQPGAAVRITGTSAALATSVVTVRLWRDLGSGRVGEPVIGQFALTVTPALAATGSTPIGGGLVAALLLSAGLAAMALARMRRLVPAPSETMAE